MSVSLGARPAAVQEKCLCSVIYCSFPGLLSLGTASSRGQPAQRCHSSNRHVLFRLSSAERVPAWQGLLGYRSKDCGGMRSQFNDKNISQADMLEGQEASTLYGADVKDHVTPGVDACTVSDSKSVVLPEPLLRCTQRLHPCTLIQMTSYQDHTIFDASSIQSA